ncbi:MAG: LysR substrate-binding domain-containing protein [Gallionella sp.]
MTIAGEGVALLPTYACRKALEDGRLIRVMPEWHARADPVHLVYPKQKFIPKKLRVFVDMAALELKRCLGQIIKS